MVERCRKWIERHARRGNLTWSVLRIAGDTNRKVWRSWRTWDL